MFPRQAPDSSNTAPGGRGSCCWPLQVWVSLALAVSLCGIGLAVAPLPGTWP